MTESRLRLLLRAREPLIGWTVHEEGRAASELAKACADAKLPLRRWNALSGWEDAPSEAPDLCAALKELLADPQEEVVHLRDLEVELERPALRRALRELRESGERIVILSVAEERTLRGLPLARLRQADPTPFEVRELLRGEILSLALGALPPGGLERLGALARGLPLTNLRRLLRRASAAGASTLPELETALLESRREAIADVGVLELISPLPRLEDIGGLSGLKEWLRERQELFRPELLSEGLPIPRGILLMGVSGCGKSLAAKACASLWRLPLYRLDMNLVFSGLHGTPEASFHRALRALEGAAPAVLWIDELENGLGSREGGGVEAPEHLFSAFLTWLQEKPPMIFVAATANRIEALPAEVLRKGRFDQVFFLDLPHEAERRAILAIHLHRHAVEVDPATLDYLVYDTRGWSGAELEQAVIAARIRARSRGDEVRGEDLIHSVQGSVPLSRTMREQIRALREWAFGRAAPASPEPGGEEVHL